MTRAEYFAAQREITRKAARAEAEAARRIRAVTRQFVLPLVRQFYETGNVMFPKEELSRQIDHIIGEEGAKPVAAARELQADMETAMAEKLGIPLPAKAEPQQNTRERRENARSPIGSTDVRQGIDWGYGITVSGKTVSSYRRDPNTGKIIWDDTPLEYAFRKRADLSTQVWKAVEEQEQQVFDVIRGGRALGRNVKDIAKDLETYINYPNGGEKVLGRWKGMFPDTKKGIKDAYLHQYVEDMGLQWGTPGARNLLYEKTPGGATRLRAGFRQYLDERMALVKFDDAGHAKRGSTLPDAVKQYAARLGKAGLDYRAIRISRTETTAMLADEQTDIAQHSSISTGEMDFVMERGRDAWGCNCEKYAAQNPWKVDDPGRPEIPVHPNCGCVWRPRLKTDEEIMAAFRKSMQEDAEAGEEAREAGKEEVPEKTLQETIKTDSMEMAVKMPYAPDGTVLATKIDRGVVDYSHMSRKKAVREESKWLRKNGERTGNEFMSFLSSGKKVLGTWEGVKKETRVTVAELRNTLNGQPAGSVDCMHCHLDGALFSASDMNMMCRVEEIKDMIITLPNNKRYSLSVTNGERPKEDLLKITWNTLYISVKRKKQEQIGTKQLLPGQENEITVDVVKMMKNMFGWRLGKI